METDNLLNLHSSCYSDKTSIASLSSGNFILTNLNDRYYFGYNLKKVAESDEEQASLLSDRILENIPIQLNPLLTSQIRQYKIYVFVFVVITLIEIFFESQQLYSVITNKEQIMKTVQSIYKNIPAVNSKWMFYFIMSRELKSRRHLENNLLHICICCYQIQKNYIHGLFKFFSSDWSNNRNDVSLYKFVFQKDLISIFSL